MTPSPRTSNPPPDDPQADQVNSTRLQASEVPSITGVRLKPHGADAKMVNISLTGMLTECTSRVKVGSTVAVLFEGSFAVESVVGRIVRCEVSAMGRDGVLRYHVAIAFTQPLSPEMLPALPPQPPANAENPLDARDPIAAIAAAAAAPASVRNRW
jgi:PilZ domain-containing protein